MNRPKYLAGAQAVFAGVQLGPPCEVRVPEKAHGADEEDPRMEGHHVEIDQLRRRPHLEGMKNTRIITYMYMHNFGFVCIWEYYWLGKERL